MNKKARRPTTLRWRYSRDTGYHYLEDDKFGYAAVQRLAGRSRKWFNNLNPGVNFSSLKTAKEDAERRARKGSRKS